MSRSRKKDPMCSTTCRGDRPGAMHDWKRESQRRWRRSVKEAVLNGSEVYPQMQEVVDSWDAPNDGKMRWEESRGYRK